MVILFTLRNWGDRQPWHHLYRLPSSSLPSIRTWDLLDGETLAAKAHIAKLNGLIESQVTQLTSSMVDETAVPILKGQGSRGITIVSLQRKIRFNIQVDPYWLKWEQKCCELAAKNFETSEFHQDKWDCYLTLEFVWAHVPWNAISNLEPRWSYKALRDDPVLPSATTLSNIFRREYSLTMDEIKQ